MPTPSNATPLLLDMVPQAACPPASTRAPYCFLSTTQTRVTPYNGPSVFLMLPPPLMLPSPHACGILRPPAFSSALAYITRFAVHFLHHLMHLPSIHTGSQVPGLHGVRRCLTREPQLTLRSCSKRLGLFAILPCAFLPRSAQSNIICRHISMLAARCL